jgi:hypothetical protein
MKMGPGFAQTDSYLVANQESSSLKVQVMETLTGYAAQRLYPSLREIWRPVVLVLTCKNLARLDLRRSEVASLREALFARADRVATFQWLP